MEAGYFEPKWPYNESDIVYPFEQELVRLCLQPSPLAPLHASACSLRPLLAPAAMLCVGCSMH